MHSPSEDSTSKARHTSQKRSLRSTIGDAISSRTQGGHSVRPTVRARIHNSRKVVASLTAGSILAGAAITGVVLNANAAGANPWTQTTLTKLADGTGHFTSAASFVNTANGFSPGDDTPDDGVVSSRDSVMYLADIQFKASAKRVVTFHFDVGSYLDWPEQGDLFCKDGTFVKANRFDGGCAFTVPAGAVEHFTAPILLIAKDTGGVAVHNQRLSLQVGADGTGTYSTVKADPVTVVSAPATDVYVTSNQTYDESLRNPFPSKSWTTGSQAGYFVATPVPLTYPNFSPTKGASTEGQWWGTFDVSSMPVGTTFKIGGVPQTPTDGLLTIPKSSGAVMINYVVPGWPAAVPGRTCADPTIDPITGDVGAGCWGANATHDFPVRVNVDPGSFSVDGGLVNNGGRPDNHEIGWQPGDGNSADRTTYNAAIGSRAGKPYANNDWTAVRVTRSWTKPKPAGDLPVVYKSIEAPTDTTRTVWESRNKTTSSGSAWANRACSDSQCMGAAPETELRSVISTTTGDHILNGTGSPATPDGNPDNGTPIVMDRMIFGDTWDNREQTLDITRQIALSASLAGVGEAGGHVVQWSTAVKSSTQVANLNDSGWITGWPTDAQVAATVRSIRVIVEATESAPFKPRTEYEVTIPLSLADETSLAAHAADRGWAAPETAYDGRAVANTASLHAVTESNNSNTTSHSRNILVRLQRDARVGINHNSSVPTPTASGYAPVGDPLDFRIDSAIYNVADTSKTTVHPKVVVELDKCLATPENTSSAWKMTIEPAVKGSDGRVCDSADTRTPEEGGPRGAILTFTPSTGDSTEVAWTNRPIGTGSLPRITYTAVPAMSLRAGAVVTSGATITLDPVLDNVELPASDDTSQMVAARETNAAKLQADFEKVEIDKPLSWTWQIFSTSPLLSEAENSSVLILPFMGDGEIFEKSVEDGLYNSDAYDDLKRAKASSFAGSYTLKDVSFTVDDTSARAKLYYTTDPITDLNPGASENWLPVNGADPVDLAKARAIKVVMEPGNEADETSTAKVHITLQPEGNERDDVYVLWPSRTALTGEFDLPFDPQDTAHQIPAPFPDDISVVASTITGTVWWDPDSNGRIGTGEDRVEGAEVTLHLANEDGTPGEQLASTLTDENGFYIFDSLHSGKYVTVVHRGDVIPKDVTTYYNETLLVDQTYSYKSKYGQKAQEVSSIITLKVDAVVPDVDFGFYQPDPKVALDKSEATVTCTNGLCKVVWEVTVTNTGKNAITDGVFYDRLGNDTVDVEVRGLTVDDRHVFVTVKSGYYFHFGVTASNDVYVWGRNNLGALGTGNANDKILRPTLRNGSDGKFNFNQFFWDGELHIYAENQNTVFAVTESGDVYVWGYGYNVASEGLGVDDLPTPTLRTSFNRYWWDGELHITTGVQNYGVTESGDVYGWGQNSLYNLGTGSNSPAVQSRQTLLSDMKKFFWDDELHITSFGHSSYGVTASGDVYVWGQYAQGQLGDGASTLITRPTLRNGSNGKFNMNRFWWDNELHIWSGGGRDLFGVTAAGELYVWGENATGALGNGNTTNVLTPVLRNGSDGRFNLNQFWWGGKLNITFNHGAHHFGVTASGDVYEWGQNDRGQSGYGTTTNILTPRLRNGTDGKFDMRQFWWDGELHLWQNTLDYYFGTTASGDIYSWGYNADWMFTLGNGGKTPVLTPTLRSDFMPKIAYDIVYEPSSVEESGDLTTRGYDLETLKAGESRKFQVTATYLQPSVNAGAKVVVNQAWVDSSLTPYEGLHGKPEPDPARTPSPSEMDPKGVSGNNTCDTNADPDNLQGDPAIDEDSCDQVPGKLPALTTQTGSLSGVAWVDVVGDGLRADDEPLLPGVTVTLLRNGALYGEAITDEDGAYTFANLPPITGYKVQFGVSHLDADGSTYAFVAANVGNPSDTAWNSAQSRDSDANKSTGLTDQSFSITAGQTTRNVDVGVEVFGPAILAVKTSELGDDVTVKVSEGEVSDPLSVYFTFTNVGDEPLTDIEWVDVTNEGPDVENFVCEPNIDGLVLAVGDSVTCTGTLPAMAVGDTHTDTVTVTARGENTKKNVTGDDPFTLAVNEKSWEPPVVNLPGFGGHVKVAGLVLGGLALMFLVGVAVTRGVQGRGRTVTRRH